MLERVARAIFEATKPGFNVGVGWDCMSDRLNLSEETKEMFRGQAQAAIAAMWDDIENAPEDGETLYDHNNGEWVLNSGGGKLWIETSTHYQEINPHSPDAPSSFGSPDDSVSRGL